MEAWELLIAFAGSFVAGYFGSALGLVLGTLRLPLIVLASGSPLAAAGTNIAISAAAAAAGSARHIRERRVDWRIVAWMAPPSVAGAIVGALLADDVSETLLYGLIAAVLVWSGVDLALRPIRPRTRGKPRVAPAAVFGLLIGAVGGAVGVILGTLRMPALVRSVGLDVRRAAGTNLVVGFLLGVAGFATHAATLDLEWGILAAGLAGAIPGGWLGARWTGLASEQTLRLALGVTLVAVGLAFAVQAVRGGNGDSDAAGVPACSDPAFRMQDEELYVAQATAQNAARSGIGPDELTRQLRQGIRALRTRVTENPPCSADLQEIAALETRALDGLERAAADLEAVAPGQPVPAEVREAIEAELARLLEAQRRLGRSSS